MVDVKQATQIAREYARDVLGESQPTLEEIEREIYKDRDVWKITLGFPSATYSKARADFGLPMRDYKSFLIDVDTGETLAMRLREFAY